MKAARGSAHHGVRRRAPPQLNADALNALLDAAGSHYAAGRIEEAASLYLNAEAQAPEDIRAQYSLAVIDIRRARFEDARARLQEVTRAAADHFAAWHNLGVTQQALGRWRLAADAYAKARALRPQAVETGFALAIALAIEGRTDAAINLYRALAADPAARGRALARLAILRPGAVTDDELEMMQRGVDHASGEAVIATRFALGAVLEAREEFDAAFANLETGALLKRAVLEAGDAASRPAAVEHAHERSAAHVRRRFTPEFIADRAGAGDARAAPIFIVGFPRCGSSLVEQILASHPQVQGLGEIPALSSVVDGRLPYAPMSAIDSDPFRQRAADYLSALAQYGWRSRSRPVDKTLENYLHVGELALMFPRAVILHCLRDPLDTCVACYRQLFASGNETLYDLAQIGREYARYRDLMDHWEKVLPGRLTALSYEALVAAPEPQIRWLVTEACGLSWAPQCLKFYETRRPVATASVAQARQPIYLSSLGRWRRYERHLAPLISALGSYAPARS